MTLTDVRQQTTGFTIEALVQPEVAGSQNVPADPSRFEPALASAGQLKFSWPLYGLTLLCTASFFLGELRERKIVEKRGGIK